MIQNGSLFYIRGPTNMTFWSLGESKPPLYLKVTSEKDQRMNIDSSGEHQLHYVSSCLQASFMVPTVPNNSLVREWLNPPPAEIVSKYTPEAITPQLSLLTISTVTPGISSTAVSSQVFQLQTQLSKLRKIFQASYHHHLRAR